VMLSRPFTILAMFVLVMLALLSAAPASAQSDASTTVTTSTAAPTLDSARTALDMLASRSDLGIPAMTVTTDANGAQNYTVSIQILMLMTALTLLPALLMMMTSFTRIIVVFAICVRPWPAADAVEPDTARAGAVPVLFIMAPVLIQINEHRRCSLTCARRSRPWRRWNG
jgi:flagellar biosynthetic protein FliP